MLSPSSSVFHNVLLSAFPDLFWIRASHLSIFIFFQMNGGLGLGLDFSDKCDVRKSYTSSLVMQVCHINLLAIMCDNALLLTTNMFLPVFLDKQPILYNSC